MIRFLRKISGKLLPLTVLLILLSAARAEEAARAFLADYPAQFMIAFDPAGMEIDFGGIGKEYAVDRTAQILSRHLQTGILINYGGDLFAVGPRVDGTLWQVGIDDPAASGKKLVAKIPLNQGGLATSGDARRYLLKNNIRYSHILDPQTGWPVKDAPRSVTVLAPTCLEAGMLATFAMLEGLEAKTFLEGEGMPFWLVAGDSAL